MSYTKFLGIFVISRFIILERIDYVKLSRESSDSKSFLKIISFWQVATISLSF